MMVPMCHWPRRNLSSVLGIGVVFAVRTFIHSGRALLPILVLLLLCLVGALGSFPHVVPFPYMGIGETCGRHCELSIVLEALFGR